MYGSYSYILLYLTFPIFRRPNFMEYSSTFVYSRIDSSIYKNDRLKKKNNKKNNKNNTF